MDSRPGFLPCIFSTLQVCLELLLLSHNLSTACQRFWLHFLNHLFFILPSISAEILSPPFHLHIRQSQHLLGGNTVCYSSSLSNLSSSLSYNHAYRVTSTRKALPTNPTTFPTIYLEKLFNVSCFFLDHICEWYLPLVVTWTPPSGGGSWAVCQ